MSYTDIVITNVVIEAIIKYDIYEIWPIVSLKIISSIANPKITIVKPLELIIYFQSEC